MKPTPASRMAREMPSTGTSSLTPSAVSTSEAPESDDDAAVAMLGDPDAGAGRDQARAGRDIEGAVAVAARADDIDGAVGGTRYAHIRARSICAAPVISSTVSPRTRSAIRKAPIWAWTRARRS